MTPQSCQNGRADRFFDDEIEISHFTAQHFHNYLIDYPLKLTNYQSEQLVVRTHKKESEMNRSTKHNIHKAQDSDNSIQFYVT